MAIIDIISNFLGKKHQVKGSTIKILVDDKLVYSEDTKVIDIMITVTGDVKELHSGSGDVLVNGNVNHVTVGSGNVGIAQYVAGNVKTGSGDIEVEEHVGGNVETESGDVKCTSVTGSVNTGSGCVYF